MFAKLVALILSAGVLACVLLGFRQLRLNTAGDIVRIEQRMIEHDRSLLRLRIEIARRIMPDGVHTLAVRFGDLTPIRPGALQAALETQYAAAEPEPGSVPILRPAVFPQDPPADP